MVDKGQQSEEPQPTLPDPSEETHAENTKPPRLPAELRHFPPPDRLPDSSMASPALTKKAGRWCLTVVWGSCI